MSLKRDSSSERTLRTTAESSTTSTRIIPYAPFTVPPPCPARHAAGGASHSIAARQIATLHAQPALDRLRPEGGAARRPDPRRADG
jgi:hypothetical protein